MVAALVVIAFVVCVLLFARWTSRTGRGPQTCCSRQTWPPDDITAHRG